MEKDVSLSPDCSSNTDAWLLALYQVVLVLGLGPLTTTGAPRARSFLLPLSKEPGGQSVLWMVRKDCCRNSGCPYRDSRLGGRPQNQGIWGHSQMSPMRYETGPSPPHASPEPTTVLITVSTEVRRPLLSWMGQDTPQPKGEKFPRRAGRVLAS